MGLSPSWGREPGYPASGFVLADTAEESVVSAPLFEEAIDVPSERRDQHRQRRVAAVGLRLVVALGEARDQVVVAAAALDVGDGRQVEAAQPVELRRVQALVGRLAGELDHALGLGG